MKKLPLLFFFFVHALQGQYFDYDASINLQGLYTSGSESPFWMHSNQRGRIDESTTLAGWSDFSAKYFITPDAYLESGVAVGLQNGYWDNFRLDEYYVSFKSEKWRAFVGKKHRKDLYRGLSATNENILWSLHARALPGFGFQILEPITIWKEGGLGIKASWEEYTTDEDRYVDHLRVHHKSFHFVFDKIRNVEFIFGIQHFAQWGGVSPTYGRLPQDFNDYQNVLIGKEGKDDVNGEEANALGNHLGSYEVYLNTSFSHFDLELIYNTIFEDNSGRVLGNTPDGRYGVYIEDQESDQKWVQALMYEFYYTLDQSENTPTGDGKDNYFNNNLYRSGWTYEQRILGAPFFLLDEDRFRVAQNTLRVHHLGITGMAFHRYPYRFLTSFRENYGVKGGQETPQNRILSSYLDVLVWQELIDVNLQIGADIYLKEEDRIGVGLSIKKEFF